MKRIGLIGGLGPESTIDYYKELIYAFTSKDSSLQLPEIVIFSVNMSELLEMMRKRDLKNLTDWLLDKIQALSKAGVEIAAMSANTPHIVFDEVQARSPIPLISIVEATREYVLSHGFKKPGLMGTGFTMKESFYPKAFEDKGIKLILPNVSEQHYIHEKLFSEIELGIMKDDTRAGLYNIAKEIKKREAIDSLILGCTELPLIMDDPNFEIEQLNTTKIHVEAILKASMI
jgi:aspartate racemase